MHPEDTVQCFSSHMGVWLIEPNWIKQALWAVHQNLPLRLERGNTLDILDGIAYIPIVGPIAKSESKFGGTSSVLTRRNVEIASRSDSVKGIFLHVDSPGGQAAGTQRLAASVMQAATRKPVHAHYEDLAASAAIWASVGASRITASPTTLIGSIGTKLTLFDTSEQFKREGVRAIDISTGPFKAAGEDGIEITGEQIEYFQGIVEEINNHFVSDVQKSRAFDQSEIDTVSDGRLFIAEEAASLGLIDGVQTTEEAFSDLQSISGE